MTEFKAMSKYGASHIPGNQNLSFSYAKKARPLATATACWHQVPKGSLFGKNRKPRERKCDLTLVNP